MPSVVPPRGGNSLKDSSHCLGENLGGHEKPHVLGHPAEIHLRLVPGPLEGVGPQVDDLRPRRLDANGGGDVPLENGEVESSSCCSGWR